MRSGSRRGSRIHSTRRHSSNQAVVKNNEDVLYFGVMGDKYAHNVIRFDFQAQALTTMDAEKGSHATFRFATFSKVRLEKAKLLLTLETKETSLSWECYNEFDFDSIERLCNKIIGRASDLAAFWKERKPQLCFVQGQGWLKKNMRAESEIRFILVERMAIIHPPGLESQPQYLFPLWKRPCFTVGKNGVRFDTKKKSVDVFFASEDVRDDYFHVIGIAAQKTPSDSVPLRKKLEMLVRLANTPFQPPVPSHRAYAQRLWEATIAKRHEGETMPASTESERWKELGLSTTALALDLKVSNMLGLVCMVYFAETYGEDLMEIVDAQWAAPPEERYAVFPNLARISYMFFSLLNLGKRPTSWYPSFVTYPMWNYDPEAFELLVCIGLRLFNKKWESASRNPTQCMNDLVADLADTLARPPSSDGVPYVFSMFKVLLRRKATGERRYSLPEAEEQTMASSSRLTSDAPDALALDAWSFAQNGFLSLWMAAETDRRDIMMNTPFSQSAQSLDRDKQAVAATRAEKKRLEIKWEAVKGVHNEFKQKFLCRVCEKKNSCVVILPCSCLAVCATCYTEGMVCPTCKSYALGHVEVVFDDSKMMTLR